MDKPAITKGRRHVAFPLPTLTPPSPTPEQLMPLTRILGFSEGRSKTVDLSSAPCERVARELLSALASLCEYGNRVNSSRTIQGYVEILNQFLYFLREQHPETYITYSVVQLCKQDIDAFEELVRTQASRETSTNPYQKMRIIISLLREWMNLHPDRISTSLRERLVYITNGPVGMVQPRDGYSPRVAEAIKAACKEEIPKIIHRITVQGEELLAQGQDPAIDGWDKPQNVLWFIAHHGVLPYRKWLKPELGRRLLYQFLYPSPRDLVPFFVLLALTTDIAIESLKSLKIDCLKNATKDSIEVSYLKRRAHGKAWQSLRVRDGGMWTPGGLIRLVMKLTKRIRTHLQSNALWIGYEGGLRVVNFRTAATAAVEPPNVTRFARDHDLRDEQGAPLVFHPIRLRKTRRKERYLATGGQLQDFSGTIHTLAVAGDHYGDIPELRPFHEDTIEHALQSAYQEATSTIVPPDEEQELRHDSAHASERLGIAAPQVAEIFSGERDLWLASCKDFYNSPFGSKGSGCPVPFWGCLDCPNAVITSRKLPGIIAFLNFLALEREVLPDGEWMARYRHVFERIVHQILPAFPEAIVTSARAIAASQEDLIYLPPNLQTLRQLP